MVKFIFAARPAQLKHFAALDLFISRQHSRTEEARTASVTQAQRRGLLVLGMALGAAAVSLGVAHLSTHSITVPLTNAVKIGVMRRHRLPDQHPGAERGRGGGPCRRAGPRRRGGGR